MNQWISSLDLSENKLGSLRVGEGYTTFGETFAKVLASNNLIDHVNFSKNKLSDDDIIPLVHAMAGMSHCVSCLGRVLCL